MAEKVRTFIAIPLPANIRQALEKEARQIEYGNPLRFSPSENLHITLLFLGDVPVDKLGLLSERLQQQLAAASFAVQVDKITGFPRNKARIVAATIRPQQALRELHRQVADIADSLSLDYDKKRFRPHITLARSRREIFIPDHLLSMSFTVNQCCVYTSELTENGPIYTVAARKELSKA